MNTPTIYNIVNVEIFVLYIFSRYSRFRNIRENMFIVKITYIMPYIDNNLKNANINPHEIANFHKLRKFRHAKISTFTVTMIIIGTVDFNVLFSC